MERSIEQPYPMAPGDKVDLYWKWTALLPPGVGIAEFTVEAGQGLTKHESGKDGLIVRALIEVDEDQQLGTVCEALCTITTDQDPPRQRTRAISISVKQQ